MHDERVLRQFGVAVERLFDFFLRGRVQLPGIDLALEGFGPKVMEELKAGLATITLPEPSPAPEPSAPVEAAAVAAEPAAAVAPAEAVAAAIALASEAAEPEAEQSFEEIIGEDEGDSDDKDKKKGKKKGKGAQREIVYDEDLGMYITRKKRKAGRVKEWEDFEE